MSTEHEHLAPHMSMPMAQKSTITPTPVTSTRT
jgi:hypothetical protein